MSHDYSAIYDPDTDFDRHFTRLTAQRIRRWFVPATASSSWAARRA